MGHIDPCKKECRCHLLRALWPCTALFQPQQSAIIHSHKMSLVSYPPDPLWLIDGMKKYVILANSDMLHSAILPYEELWRRSFPNLKFVVGDDCTSICDYHAQIEEGMGGGREPFGSIHQFLSHGHQPAGGHEAPVWDPPKVGLRNYGDLQSAPFPDGAKGPDHCVLSDPQDVQVVNEAGEVRCSGEWATGDEETMDNIIAITTLELDVVIGLGFPHLLSGLIQQAGRVCQNSKELLAMLVNNMAWTNTIRAIQKSSLRPGEPRSRLICTAQDSSSPIFNVPPTRSRLFQSPIASSSAHQSPAVFTTSGLRQSELLSFASAISLPTYLDQRNSCATHP
ncbi:hypothetical protein VP01_1625g2 [Puccinia sorghi]|uniref:Uncharacterized protein n=1 Tax=Puccinia sorghi TaxID=27349 RepID=A0A0L6VGX7_9BASI|nr:hypothetical protein VP01_1625g2 [Puccinia sorghi]